MRTVTAELQSHLEQKDTTFAVMMLFTRRDASRLGITSYDRDVAFDLGDGVVTYHSSPSFAPVLFRFIQGLRDTASELKTALDGTIFDRDEVRAGVWRDAAYQVFLIDPEDPTKGQMILERGNLGGISLDGVDVTLEAHSLANRFQQPVAETLTEGCPFVLGSTQGHGGGCKVVLDPGEWLASFNMDARVPRQASGSVVRPVDALLVQIFNNRHYICTGAGTTGPTPPTFQTTIGATFPDGSVTWTVIRALTVVSTVASVIDQRTFTVTGSIDSPTGWLDGGFFEWTSGDNLPVGKVEARAWDTGLQQLTLTEPAYFTIQVGDAFKCGAGCDHVLDGDCVNKFDNAHNYGGLLFTPGTTRIQEIVSSK